MISQQQYAAFRESSLASQPLRRQCGIEEIHLISLDTIEYSGLRLGLKRSALKDLIKIGGLSTAGFASLEKSIGEAAAQSILNALKNAIGLAKGLRVTLVVSPDRQVTAIQKSTGSLISAETYFDTFERIANNHNLEIQSTHFNPDNGNCYLSAITAKGQFQVGNLSDEVFTTGISLAKTADGIQIDPFMNRLICGNGMVQRTFEDSFNLNSMDPRKWQEFYTHLERIERGAFVPGTFSSKVTAAINTPASFLELEAATGLILKNSNCPQDEIEYFIKGYKHTHSRFQAAGIDTEALVNAQKANLRTGVSVWDCINGVTDFASHNYGYEKKANSDRHLQMAAGQMLSKQFDTQNIVMHQPF